MDRTEVISRLKSEAVTPSTFLFLTVNFNCKNMQEVWKSVVGYEGLYQVSNLGSVYSLPKKWIGAKGCLRSHNGKIMSVTLSPKGYPRVLLSNNGKTKTREIHQLVAESFLNHKVCGYKIVVDHIDNNKLNNNACNLQLVSQRYNSSKDRLFKTSKYIGVYFDKSRNKYATRIQINGKNIFIGRFDDEYKAHLAYQNKLNEINQQLKNRL